MTVKKELVKMSDQFSRNELQSALAFARILKTQNAVSALKSSIINSLPIVHFVGCGMSISQINEALEVVKWLHRVTHDTSDLTMGVSKTQAPAPTIIFKNGEDLIVNISWVPAGDIEEGILNILEKKKIVLHQKMHDNRVCLDGEIPLCYSLKGQDPGRFRIISSLFEAESGISAKDIANSLSKDGDDKIVQDNIKKEIAKINQLFKKSCNTQESLISHSNAGSKNIYFLNKKHFYFQKVE